MVAGFAKSNLRGVSFFKKLKDGAGNAVKDRCARALQLHLGDLGEELAHARMQVDRSGVGHYVRT